MGLGRGPAPRMSRRGGLGGCRPALAEASIAVDPKLIAAGAAAIGYDDTHAAEHGRAAAAGLLRLARPPTALVALNDMHAVGARAAVRDARGSVPDDVSVVRIDDITIARLIHPALTPLPQPIE